VTAATGSPFGAISNAAAVVADGASLTYGALEDLAVRVARNLRRAGVEPGARVALQLGNSWQAPVVLYGCWRAGAVACPLDVRLPRAALSERIRLVAASHCVVAGDAPEPDGAVCLAADDLLAEGDGKGASHRPPEDPGALATILFTSGSSGRPKAVAHALAAHRWSALGANANAPLTPGDRWLLALPLCHVGGLGILFRCAQAGATVAIPRPGESIGDAVARLGITHVSLVPTQLHRLLDGNDPTGSLARLKVMLLGGGPASPALIAEALRRGWPVRTSYGLTEMASQVCAMPAGASASKLGTSGRLLAHRELRIAGDGEILVRGPTLFRGYLEGAALDLPTDAEGWFATGDLGALDDDGYLTVSGRRDRLFISGGENIQPEEIESRLAALPGVAEAVVVPRPDAEFGARPVAFLRWSCAPLPEAELRDRLGHDLPRFKIPVRFREWPEGAMGLKTDLPRFQALAVGD
jgi:O-succinylbenzoic acid--CoA ligase